jgi:hypothetical protein
MSETREMEKAMTVDEIAKEIRKLPIHEQLILLETLSQAIREKVQRRLEKAETPLEEVDTHAEFREAWNDALTGNTRPVSELWAALDAE